MIVFDFDGVFTDNRVLVFQDGSEAVFCSRSDGIGLERMKRLGIKLLVLSSEVNPVVGERCKKLGLDCIQGCKDKPGKLKAEAKKMNIELSEIAYLGNDINDIDCLKMIGFPACVKDSHPKVLKFAKYVTLLPGGYGAVREFCGLIEKVKR